MPSPAGASGETTNTPVRAGRCLYRAERAYVDDAGIGHEVLHLYATGHTVTGTPMDEWDWPEGLDLWHLVFDFDEHGRAIVDPAPFDEQWTGPPAPVITLWDGQPPPAVGVMRQEELHVACESRCTAAGAEFRNVLTEFRAERHRHHAALAQLEEAQARRSAALAEIDQLEARSETCLPSTSAGILTRTDSHRPVQSKAVLPGVTTYEIGEEVTKLGNVGCR